MKDLGLDCKLIFGWTSGCTSRASLGNHVEFRSSVRRLGWSLLDGGALQFGPRRSRRFVVGVALWSWPDLAALEDLAAVSWIRDKGIPVEVFDFDSCLTFDGLSTIVPGVPPISQTPLLAEYEGDRLVDYRVGMAVSLWCREFSRHDSRALGAEVEATSIRDGSIGGFTPRPHGGSSRLGSTA